MGRIKNRNKPSLPSDPMITTGSEDRDHHQSPGVIDFLDNRWRFAESSDAAARRAVLLLVAALIAGALAFSLLIALLALVSVLAERLPEALLTLLPLLGGTTLGITIYRRPG